jgi:hypothetical protein
MPCGRSACQQDWQLPIAFVYVAGAGLRGAGRAGWTAIETRVALPYAAVWVVALTAWQAGRPDLIRSPRLVLAHVSESLAW